MKKKQKNWQNKLKIKMKKIKLMKRKKQKRLWKILRKKKN